MSYVYIHYRLKDMLKTFKDLMEAFGEARPSEAEALVSLR
jgi:hypothetical protein